VVAQPYRRGAKVPAPGKIDAGLGEFWVDNPWDITSMGRNLSNHERQRLYLNQKGTGFFDISFLSGADAAGDGRSVIAGDFRNNGQLDLVVFKVGGGALTIYENQCPRKHYLEVSLRGRRSNSLGIGARLIAEVKGQTLVRELYPVNSFRSQMPSRLHFGLGDESHIDRLTIRWPSGHNQSFANLRADRHILVDEGKNGEAAVQTVVPGNAIIP
jgi:enediyne biosynthesis protein E4